MDVTPQELRGSEIKDAWRGYDRDEVDDLLERAAVTIEHLMLQVHEAQAHPPIAAAAAAVAAVPEPAPAPVPLPSSRDDAEMLQRTLLLAQRAADEAVAEAQERARQIVAEAEAKAQALVGDAEATARRIAEGERRRLEAEIQELSARRELLRGDADALDSYAASYRDKIRESLEADLAALTSGGPVDSPTTRPELHEVEIPVSAPPAEPAAAAAPAPVAEAAPSWDPGPATTAVVATAAPAPAPVSAPAPAPVQEAAPQGEWPPVARAEAAAPAAAASPSSPSSWLADDSHAEAALDAPAPWERDTAYHEPFTSDTPMEANSVDTDSLSDDQFFASLRDAVRDDAPLGPSDENVQGDFFDPEPDDDRRRGFRRRK